MKAKTMAKDPVTLNIVNENHNHKESDRLYDDEIEMIFGRPPQTPASPKTHATSNIHMINNERRHSNHFNGGLNNSAESDSERPTQPLLEPPRDRQLPPLAGPEVDDLDGDPPKDVTPFPGIDDGLLEPSDKKPDYDHEDGDHDYHPELDPDKHPLDRDDAATDGKSWAHDEPDGAYGMNNLGTRFGDNGSRPISPAFSGVTQVIPDFNTYQQKKNLAQGMMDLALLSANANQLRYVLESSDTHPYYYPSLVFIALSILFQIAVGVGLIMNSRYNVKKDADICAADKINNMTVLGVFLITIVNVFITSFSVATVTPPVGPKRMG